MRRKATIAIAVTAFCILLFGYVVRAVIVHGFHDDACLVIGTHIAGKIEKGEPVTDAELKTEIASLIRASVINGRVRGGGNPTDLNGNPFHIQQTADRVSVSTRFSLLQPNRSHAEIEIKKHNHPVMPAMDVRVQRVIEALQTFVPNANKDDSVYRLYGLLEGFADLPGRESAIPAMFSLLERFPDCDFGSPGPLVSELEGMAGYKPFLRESVRRRPVFLTVWMVNRILNSKLAPEERQSWMRELRAVLECANASADVKDDAREFLERQARRH